MSRHAANSQRIFVGIGEVLFDIFEDGRWVVRPLMWLCTPTSWPRHSGWERHRGQNDPPGRQILSVIGARGMSTRYITVDPQHPTGRVSVFMRGGEPGYQIELPAAWDFIAPGDSLDSLAARCHAVCFGSLAQRSPASRSTIRRFLEKAPQAVRLYDVNLRQNTISGEKGYGAEIVDTSCRLAAVIKSNQSELIAICDLLGIDTSRDPAAHANRRRIESLLTRFPVRAIVLTRGGEGTLLFTRDREIGVDFIPIPPDQVHPVGAGHASSAGHADVAGFHPRLRAPDPERALVILKPTFMERVFLIDTDTASDDAVALIMALRAPGVRVAAITTVAGNVEVEQATRNALYTAELCGAGVPVFMGAPQPLLRVHQNATWFHGRDGLGDHGYPPPRRSPEKEHAVDAIIRTVDAHPGLVLVTLGPLTNVALALARKPQIAAQVGRCVVMGGAPCCEGNVTPAAEYNIWVDPEAARVVLRSGLPVELVGWQLSRGDAVLNAADIDFALALNTDRARFAIECNSHARAAYLEQTGEHGIALPDPVAMAVALDPAICTHSTRHYVDVETASELTRGMTVVDRLNVAGNHRNRALWADLLAKPPNTAVCWTLDVKRWKEALFSALQ